MAVYGKVLAPAEVDAHYQAGRSANPAKPYPQLILESSPLAYYRLGEAAYSPPTSLPVARNLGSAGTAGDGSYNPGMNGQAAGPQAPKYLGFGADNTAGGFNGTAGHVGTPVTLSDLTQFTVLGWIKRDAVHSGRGGYFGQNDLLEFGDADAGANIEAWINAYGTNIKIPYPFADGEWGLIALVGDATKGTVLYTNGVAASSIDRTVDTFGASDYLFNIGGGGVFNTAGDYFLGAIDEVAIFGRALSAADLQTLYFAANIAPSIVTQPAGPDRDIFEGNTVTLSVVAAGTPPLRYQWRKGGSELSGKTSATLTLSGVTLADAGTYDVVVSNDHGTVASDGVTLAVKPADTVAPVLQYAAGTESFDGVRVWFSESLDPVTAQNTANYQVSGGLTVVSATLSAPAGSPGDNIVLLKTAPQTVGTTYTLTVNGVKDQSAPGNAVAADSKATFSSWALVPGYLTFEHYDAISGAAISDITRGLTDPRVVARKPTTAGYVVGRFDTRTIFPDDSHEQYLVRISGFITPTESGQYYFFLRSDDAGQLFLSKNETLPDPAKDTPIAVEEGCCGAFAEPDSGDIATTAEPIALEAGKRYGVTAILKEATGGDYLMVAWRKDSDLTPAASLPYLPGQYFATYADPNVDVAFTRQPTDQPGVLPTPVVNFASVDFKTTDGGFSVENTENAPPGPWNYDGTAGAWSADGGESACSGPYNSRLVSPVYTLPETEEVTLTFSHRYSFEGDYWDGGLVQISVNGADFVGVNPENFTANGYASGNIQGSGVAQGQRAFNGDSAGYANGEFVTSSVILGSFNKGDKIAVRFVGAWDECTTGSVPGWVIRSFQLAYGKAAQAATFTAEAAVTRQGTPVTFGYQWQRNGGTGFVDIADATSASYRFFPAAADFDATYRVLAGVPGRMVPSNLVKLTQGGAAPEIAIARAGTTVTVTFTGTLQSAVNPAGPYTAVAGATSPYTVPIGAGTSFYRSAR